MSTSQGYDCPDNAYPLMSRAEIASKIADGQKLIIVNQHVLKLDAWLPFHPGGFKTVLHMVGKDASAEVKCFHSPEALKQMNKYRVGRIKGAWENFLPPIQGGIFCSLGIGSTLDTPFTQETWTTSSVTSPVISDCGKRSCSLSPDPLFDDENFKGETQFDVRVARTSRHRDSSHDEPALGPGTGGSIGMSFLDLRTREEICLDTDKYPSLDMSTQRRILDKYYALYNRVEEEGLFDCNYMAYSWEVARYTALFVLMLLFLHMRWYVTSATCLGMFWHQLVFTAHDAGHIGITHNFHGDSIIGIIIADFLGGLSLCWWKDNHNVHHIVTNSPEHDPDIEHMPFFAISHRFLQSLRSSYYDRIMTYDAASRLFIRFQAWLYYVVLCFGRFNLYRLSWQYIFLGLGPRKGPARWYRWLEATGQVFFWYWFGYEILYQRIDTNWHRIVFIMVSHAVTMPLHLQITLSHFAMSTTDLGPHESFPQRMLRTTMDVDCPKWLDFFHGGLQFQAIHHLWPRMPRHNLRRAQELVQKFCDEVDIPYALYGFVDGNREVLGRLADVSRQASILAQCQQAIAQGKV